MRRDTETQVGGLPDLPGPLLVSIAGTTAPVSYFLMSCFHYTVGKMNTLDLFKLLIKTLFQLQVSLLGIIL